MTLNRMVKSKYILAIFLSRIEFNSKNVVYHPKLDLKLILFGCQSFLFFESALIVSHENTYSSIN